MPTSNGLPPAAIGYIPAPSRRPKEKKVAARCYQLPLPNPDNYSTPMTQRDTTDRLARRTTLLDPEEPIGAVPKRRTQSGIKADTGGASAPQRTQWNLDADQIIEKLKTNQTFKTKTDFNAMGLPIFGDMTRYGVTEEKQLELFSAEVRRLVKIVNSAEPISLEGEDDWFGHTDEDGYGRLNKLSRQLVLAISICLHDVQLQILKHNAHETQLDAFIKSREILLREFGPDAPKDPAETWSQMRLEHVNDKALHCLINYLTGTVIQVLLRTMHGKMWDDNCIIGIAKCAAKIKVVAMDLPYAAEICLSGKREWLRNMERLISQEPNPATNEEKKSEGKTAAEKEVAAMGRVVSVRATRYFKVMHAFGHGLLVILYEVVVALGTDREAALPPHVFESCSIVYDTGFRGRRSRLCQEGNGAIGSSGSREDVHCSSFTFDVCLRAFENLKQRQDRCLKTARGAAAKSTTLVYWKRTELRSEADDLADEMDIFKGDPQEGQLEISLMRDAITALIPFYMVCGGFPSALAWVSRLAMSASDYGDAIAMCFENRFLASFLIRTSEYEAFKKKTQGDDPNVTSVSTCPLAEERALAHGPMSSTAQSRAMMDGDRRLRQQLLQKNKLNNAGLEKMERWIIDNDSIIIEYRKYCWGTLASCAVLIVGGLAIGFSVNERIQGVDPFNISVFCWALAGFIVIFMKSIRVENWPWRDFFRGRVVCRSVSEVLAVSRMEEQLFLTILLRLEPTNVMNKKGPFCAVFMRTNPNLPAFHIDVPFKTESLIAAGLFFIKVESIDGPALAIIRATTKSSYNAVEPQSLSQDESDVKCRDFRDPAKWGRGNEQRNMYGLSTNELSWSRVFGIFWEDAYYQ